MVDEFWDSPPERRVARGTGRVRSRDHLRPARHRALEPQRGRPATSRRRSPTPSPSSMLQGIERARIRGDPGMRRNERVARRHVPGPRPGDRVGDAGSSNDHDIRLPMGRRTRVRGTRTRDPRAMGDDRGGLVSSSRLNSMVMGGPWATEEYIRFITSASRRTCTPDVAKELSRVGTTPTSAGMLPTIQAPMLLVHRRGRGRRGTRALHRRAEFLDARDHDVPGSATSSSRTSPRSIAAIRRFIGAERPPLGLDSVLATVLFTDIVGSTERGAALGDAAWQEIHERHDRIVRHELERHRGREIKRTGDGFLATFDGPARGVHCARAIAEEMQSLGIEIRAGSTPERSSSTPTTSRDSRFRSGLA